MLLFRGREEAEMDEELRFHLEMETERNIARGMDPRLARRQARLAFGGLEGHREALRDVRRWAGPEDVFRDLRYGVRSLLRVPGFTVTIVVALALGTGTSVAVFSVVRQLVTDMVPFEQPERLFSVEMSGPRGFGVSPTAEDFTVWQRETASVGALAGYAYQPRAIGDGSHTTYATAFRVTDGFFELLALRPLLGRTFSDDDHRPAGAPVAMLSESLWEKHFGRDEGIIGRTLLVDGQPHVAVGIVPAGLNFPSVADFWTAMPADEAATNGGTLSVIGRLAPGRTHDEARIALQALQASLDADRPEEDHAGRLEILPLTGRNSDRAEIVARFLQGAVLLVLLIGIANGTGLMLTRGMLRRRETAVRTSLGASRVHIVRQILTESTLLAAAGGVLGIGVGWVLIKLLRNGLPASMARQMLGWDALALDAGAVLFALVLVVAAALACGLVPALHALRENPSMGLKEEGAGAPAGRAGGRITRLLVVGEVALSLTLLLTAGLLTRSLVELVREDTGYDAEGVFAAQWVLPVGGYTEGGAIARFQEQLLESVRAVPGAATAGIVSTLPTAPFGATRRFRVAGSDPEVEGLVAAWRPISPEYLDLMGIELLQGRPLQSTDGASALRVAIVDESLARTLAAEGGVVVGSRIDVAGEMWTVVGVSRTVVNPAYPGAVRRTIYVPQVQAPTRSGYVLVRAEDSAQDLTRHVHDAIWRLDPEIAIGTTATIGEIDADLRWSQRVMAVVIALFAVIALVITTISLYALVAHAVARRQREFGIRLALGAGSRRVLREAITQGMLWVAVGTGLGLLLSLGVSRLLAGLLYGIDPLDPLTFTLVPAALLVITLLASYLPARRAASVDPLVSLRSD